MDQRHTRASVTLPSAPEAEGSLLTDAIALYLGGIALANTRLAGPWLFLREYLRGNRETLLPTHLRPQCAHRLGEEDAGAGTVCSECLAERATQAYRPGG